MLLKLKYVIVPQALIVLLKNASALPVVVVAHFGDIVVRSKYMRPPSMFFNIEGNFFTLLNTDNLILNLWDSFINV
jgi:hypothetical protein